MTIILTPEQLTFSRERSYLHAPAVIPPDLLRLMRTVLSRWVDLTIDGWLADGLIDDPQSGPFQIVVFTLKSGMDVSR